MTRLRAKQCGHWLLMIVAAGGALWAGEHQRYGTVAIGIVVSIMCFRDATQVH